MAINKNINRFSYSIIILYTVLFYFIPFIFSFIWESAYKESYKFYNQKWVMLLIPVVIFLTYLFDRFLPKVNFQITNFVSQIIFNEKITFLLSVSLLGTSVWFFKNYSFSFRQHNELTDAGFLAMFLFALKAYFRVFLFGLLLKYLIGLKLEVFDKYILVNIIICFILGLSGSFDIIFILLAILLLFNIKSVLGEKKNINKSKISLGNQFLILISFLVVVGGASFVGIANKIGVDEAKILYSNFNNLEFVLQRLIMRFSTFYISLLSSAENFIKDPFFSVDAIIGTFQNSLIRVNSLLGNTVSDRPEVWSINRLNYLNIFQLDEGERTGATPGIFSMMFYVPIFPFSIVLLSIYLMYVLRVITRVSNLFVVKFNFFTKILFILNIAPLLENPLSYINFIDTAFLYFLFFVCNLKHIQKIIKVSVMKKNKIKNYESKINFLRVST